jgi:phosphoribosylglycinamide formyltransferase-1
MVSESVTSLNAVPALLTGRTRPLRIAVLVSATGANLTTLCELQREEPGHLEVVLVASDRTDSPALDVARQNDVPAWPGNFAAECGSWRACADDEDRRRYRERATGFHDRLDARIAGFEAAHGEIDLIVLAYHRWIHGRLLERFAGRMINQHPADLSRLTADGTRAYVGLDPVGDALRAGEPATRTSTFLVDDSHDGGALLAQGPWVPYAGPRPPSTGQVAAHEASQKRRSDRPALRATIAALAAGRLAVDRGRKHPDGSPAVLVDGRPVPLGGLQVGDPGEDHR